MALKNYPVNEAIQVTYQVDGLKTGQTVTMEIYDETGAKDAINFPDVTMTEIDTSGRYTGSFTPDAEGEWIVACSYDGGKGARAKQYSIGGYNLDDIGQVVDSIDGKISDTPSMIL